MSFFSVSSCLYLAEIRTGFAGVANYTLAINYLESLFLRP